MKIVTGIFFGVAAIINLILTGITLFYNTSFQMYFIIAILYGLSSVCMLIAAKGE